MSRRAHAGHSEGILVAIILSMIGLAIQAAHPRVYLIGRKGGADVSRPLSAEHPDDETIEGLLRAPPEGRIFFLNSDSVLAQVEALIKEHRPRVLALDMSRIPDIEYSALCMLDDLERRAQALGFEYWLVALNLGAPSVVGNVGLAARLGRERMPFNARAARRRFEERHASEHPASTSIGS